MQGPTSHFRGSLGAWDDGNARRYRAPGAHPEQWMGRGGWVPGEQLSSSIQMRIVPPTLPGLQGPPLEPPRSQNPHLRKWARFPRAPLPRPSLGSVGFDTSL